jgi:hypothetical protein
MVTLHSLLIWLEEHSRWNKLRDLGQSNLVRASVLMPAFGYLLLLNENVRQQLLKVLYDDSWPMNHLPSMWRIWFLFYGGFFLAFGSILFAWKCPFQIKRYATSYDMVDAERVHITTHRKEAIVGTTLKQLYEGMTRWENKIFGEKLDPTASNLGAPAAKTGDSLSLGLIHIWRAADIRHSKLRILIFVFFWSGLFLVAIPAGATFLQVTVILLNRLFS